MEKQGHVVFTVRMFGDFSILYEGREIRLGRKSTAKFIQLLQLVWIHGEQGIFKENLMKCLYDRNEVSDSNNSVNNLLYQLRRQMEKAGLPRGEYVTRIGSVYAIDENFPIYLDVHDFKQKIYLAEESEDEEDQYAYYHDAFELYRGELLPAIANEIWVMEEHLRLKAKFVQCVKWLADFYRERNDYNAMGYLFDRAAAIYPFDSWQIGQIDVLLSKGDYKKANLLYNKTVSMYLEEMGQSPSPEMQECYQRITSMTSYLPDELENIKNEIWKYPGAYAEEKGTYYCSYSGFVDICHMLSRNLERTGSSSYLMLCTLTDYEGKVIPNPDKLRARMDDLKEVIQTCLRKGDVFTQYSAFQYLIMLVGAKEDECGNIYKRINRKLKEKVGSRAELKYVAVSLTDLQPQIEWK